VNPIALNRIAGLYCKNERAIIRMRLPGSGEDLALVAVGAILVGSIHLNFLDVSLGLNHRGPNRIPCRASFRKGAEIGYFHHGSTIIVVATDRLEPCHRVRPGEFMRMGESLFRCR
jgi:phosphatidylserine decarboxylase